MELDHVGIAVVDLAQAVARWQPVLGVPEGPPEDVPSNRVRVVFLTAGGTHVELLSPLDAESSVAKFLANRGEGIHHLAFRVASVDQTLQELIARGDRVVDKVSRAGARGRRVGFAHPSAFGGVLVEFVGGP
jgi:methylmalonyl-CoA/ethylmalonyl-CoA epimerase